VTFPLPPFHTVEHTPQQDQQSISCLNTAFCLRVCVKACAAAETHVIGKRDGQGISFKSQPSCCTLLSSPPGSLCDNLSLRVIPRSRRRRGISHCLENTQTQIPLPRLRDRNDSLGRVITQTPRRRAKGQFAEERLKANFQENR